MSNYVYVLDKQGQPLMPTKRFGKVRWLLKNKLAVVVSKKPFTIRLKYEPETHIVQDTYIGPDSGRTNIGVAVVRDDGTCLFSAKCTTRNKDIPKLMMERAAHRRASRRGERLARKRLAKKLGTTTKKLLNRKLPGYKDGVLKVKDIINTEARFNNRKRPEGWLTPTATQLLRTHVNLIKKISKFLPISNVVVELNKFAFMQLDNPGIKKWEYAKGSLHKKGSVEDAVFEQQGSKCILCPKDIEHYHHIVPRSKGGSETLENRAGLCLCCHDKVHKDSATETKLKEKKAGLNKKYGALSVLNQIIPYLMKELESMYPGQVYATTGYSTKAFREVHNIPKDHNTDAYCIASSVLENQKVVDAPTGYYEIRQFRRHSRAIIHSQRERTYKLNGKVVARNRRKRMDQKEDSLHEWHIKTKQKFGKAEARRLQSQLTIEKSVRHYNAPDRLMPGTVFEFNRGTYVMSGQLSGGQYLRAAGCGATSFPTRNCRIVKHNQGLVFI